MRYKTIKCIPIGKSVRIEVYTDGKHFFCRADRNQQWDMPISDKTFDYIDNEWSDLAEKHKNTITYLIDLGHGKTVYTEEKEKEILQVLKKYKDVKNRFYW